MYRVYLGVYRVVYTRVYYGRLHTHHGVLWRLPTYHGVHLSPPGVYFSVYTSHHPGIPQCVHLPPPWVYLSVCTTLHPGYTSQCVPVLTSVFGRMVDHGARLNVRLWEDVVDQVPVLTSVFGRM